MKKELLFGMTNLFFGIAITVFTMRFWFDEIPYWIGATALGLQIFTLLLMYLAKDE